MKTAILVLLGTVSTVSATACWQQAYGRGAGVPPSACPVNTEFSDSDNLCYTLCVPTYTGVGPLCWADCPSGFADNTTDCLKPDSYERSKYQIWDEEMCNKENTQGCEELGIYWFPKCLEGFQADNRTCKAVCPEGYKDIGESCQKARFGRGPAENATCAEGEELNGELCYAPCSEGYHGLGPICW